jgi:glycosyltransferase involved in cell wall biosynthesis
MNIPIVSIILPTKNREVLLERSIDSILRQTFKEWELIVIYNISSVNSIDKLGKKDSRIRIYKVPTSPIPGISEYLNTGIKYSRGKYIARLDDDDIWCNPDKLKLQVEFLEDNPEYTLVGGGVNMVDAEGKIFYRFFKKENDEEIRKNALLACPFEHTTVMFRKDSAILMGGYNNYKTNEDWEFFLRLGRIGKFYNFKEYFTNYLQAGQNYSLKFQTQVAKTELSIIKLFRKEYPNYYLGVIIHSIQYLYSFFPNFIKNRFQYFLRYIKRQYF